MTNTRLGRLFGKVTDLPFADRVLGPVIDKAVAAGIARLRAKTPAILEILIDEDLLEKTKEADAGSEVLLRRLGDAHRRAGVEMLQIIQTTNDCRSMIAAVVNGFEACKAAEIEDDIEAQIQAVDDPLARTLLRVFISQRNYYLGFLKFLQDEELDTLEGHKLCRALPDMADWFRRIQSDTLHDLTKKEPRGVVADAVRAIIEFKRAGR